MFGARDDRGRIHLHAAEPPHRVVQVLRTIRVE